MNYDEYVKKVNEARALSNQALAAAEDAWLLATDNQKKIIDEGMSFLDEAQIALHMARWEGIR